MFWHVLGKEILNFTGCPSCGWLLMKYINNKRFGEVKKEKEITV